MAAREPTDTPGEPSRVHAANDNHRRWLRFRKESGHEHDADVVLGIAASFTAQPLEPQVGARLLDSGWAHPEIRFADYNQLHQVCLDPLSALGDVDHLVLMWRIEDVFERQLNSYQAGSESAHSEICEGVRELASLVRGLDKRTKASLIVSTAPYPGGWGSDLRDPAQTLRLGELHRAASAVWLDSISDLASANIIDLDAVQRYVGEELAFDAHKWALYRQPYSSEFWFVLGEQLNDAIVRQIAPPPKCIVLDCDNTVWGGVLGEDGVGGILLDDSFPGRAFREFQRQVKNLKEQGVLIAVASKNDEAEVIEVFDRHDGMVLRREDIAAWQVNWRPKAEGVLSIASDLNIGADSIVFIDDDRTELLEVGTLTGARCLAVPDDLARLPLLLSESGLFRRLSVSSEDRARTKMMHAESRRSRVAAEMDRDAFLASLDLSVHFGAADPHDVARIAQLINKTNQFNLTTIRRSEGDVRRILESTATTLYAMRVRDRFGDYGIVGVAVLDISDETWSIDTLLMSCRVLGRSIESAFLAAIVEEAVERGADRLIGRYVPTRKNAQVADFYATHGFSASAENPGCFVLDLRQTRVDVPPHIALIR